MLCIYPNTGPVTGGINIAVLGLHLPQSNQCFFGSVEVASWSGERTGFIVSYREAVEPGSVDVTIRVSGLIVGHVGIVRPRFTYRDDPRTPP
jgi:hypothetical protein